MRKEREELDELKIKNSEELVTANLNLEYLAQENIELK